MKQACQDYATTRRELKAYAPQCRAMENTFLRKVDPSILQEFRVYGCGPNPLSNDYCDRPGDSLACSSMEKLMLDVDKQALEVCNGEMALGSNGKSEIPLIPSSIDD